MNSKEEFTVQMKRKVAEIEEILKEYLPKPEGYACQGFVILGYIDGEQPKSKPRKPGRIKIVE